MMATGGTRRADVLLARLRAGETLVRVYGTAPARIPRWQWQPAGDYARGQTIHAMLRKGLIQRHGNALVIA